MRVADAVIVLAGLAILWSLIRAHRTKGNDINLFDLVLENGRLSKVSVAYMVTLIVTSWVLIRLTLDGKLTDVIYAAFGTMWVAPLVAKMFSTPPGKTEITPAEAK